MPPVFVAPPVAAAAPVVIVPPETGAAPPLRVTPPVAATPPVGVAPPLPTDTPPDAALEPPLASPPVDAAPPAPDVPAVGCEPLPVESHPGSRAIVPANSRDTDPRARAWAVLCLIRIVSYIVAIWRQPNSDIAMPGRAPLLLLRQQFGLVGGLSGIYFTRWLSRKFSVTGVAFVGSGRGGRGDAVNPHWAAL